MVKFLTDDQKLSFFNSPNKKAESLGSNLAEVFKSSISKSPSLYSRIAENILSGENPEGIAKHYVDKANFLDSIDPKLISSNEFNVTVLYKLFETQNEKVAVCIDLFKKINRSSSQAMKRVAQELINELLEQNDPIGVFKKVEQVFLRNNLPTVGKTFRVFEILHPKPTLDAKTKREVGSRVLNNVKNYRQRLAILYRDLLDVHIRSGNPSLKEYLETLRAGDELFNVMEKQGEEALNPVQRQTLENVLRKMDTLYQESLLGKRKSAAVTENTENLTSKYARLKASIGVKEGGTISGRITEMFVAPLGPEYKSVDDVLAKMAESKASAGQRGFDYAAKAQDGHLEIAAGDLIKGVDANFISNILENGSVAKEFLGSHSESDMTPLDTDLSIVSKVNLNERFEHILSSVAAASYGDILFVIKNRGQFLDTTNQRNSKYAPGKLELFQTGVTGNSLRRSYRFSNYRNRLHGCKKRLPGKFQKNGKSIS